MKTLLIAISLWLSANFELPATSIIPRIERLPAAQLAAMRYGAPPMTAHPFNLHADATPGRDVVAVYEDTGRTIFLREDWTGTTAADFSILVHEMVHHFQNVGGLKYACPEEREKLAYEAQERWLRMFGQSLESEFGIDPLSRLAKTVCMY